MIIFSALILTPFWVQAQFPYITALAQEVNAPPQPYCGGEQGLYQVLYSGTDGGNSNAKFKKAKIKIKVDGGTILGAAVNGLVIPAGGSELEQTFFLFQQSNFFFFFSLVIEWDGTDGGIEVFAEAEYKEGKMTFPTFYADYLEVDGGIEAAASITRDRQLPRCTGATFQANMPGEICVVDEFVWRINGGPEITTSGPTLVANNVDNSQTVTVSVRVRYQNGEVSATTVQEFGPNITTPYLSGPMAICPGSYNRYSVFSSPPPTSVYWQSSTNNVVISNPYSSTILLDVVGNSNWFTLSCTVTQCGERYVIRREIDILPAGGGDCPPIPRPGLPGEVAVEKSGSGQETGFGQGEDANELDVEGAVVSHSATGKESIFRFYPNPARSGMELSIQSDCSLGQNTQLTLMDATGRELQNIQLSESSSHSLSTQGLPAGVYVLRGVNECGIEAKLLTIK